MNNVHIDYGEAAVGMFGQHRWVSALPLAAAPSRSGFGSTGLLTPAKGTVQVASAGIA